MDRRNFLTWTAAATSTAFLNPGCTSVKPIQNKGEAGEFSYKGINRSVPTSSELATYYTRFSNWGRWGNEDKLGTLNFIDQDTVLNAKSLIHLGKSVSLGRPMTSGKLEMEIYKTEAGDIGSTHDTITVTEHGYTETHLDALCHISTRDGKLYNGYPETVVNEKGASIHGIENWKKGIVTRGVLYDIPKLRGVPFVPVEQPVQGWELEDFARMYEIQPRRGDATIIHCGRNSFFLTYPNNPNTLGNKPGLNPSVLEFVHAYDSALMGSDFDEAPNVDRKYPTNYSIHHIANPFMGLPTFWNLDLEPLSNLCSEQKTWEFFIVLAPLIIVGGTGSVLNPIAIL